MKCLDHQTVTDTEQNGECRDLGWWSQWPLQLSGDRFCCMKRGLDMDGGTGCTHSTVTILTMPPDMEK